MSAVASESRRPAKPMSSGSPARGIQWFGIILLLALVAVTFWPTLHNGFIWDDDLMVTDNVIIKSAAGLRDFWFSLKPTDYFPVTYSDLWIEWRLWGMNATGYHVTNLLLHAINAVLLWRVLRKVIGTTSVAGPLDIAWFGAALYALHPVNVATVAWIAERKNTLAMLFALLSANCYFSVDADKKSRRLYIASLGFFVLSLLSKTAGVMLPTVFLCLAWWKRGLTKRDVLRTAPFFAIAFVMGVITIWFQNHRALAADFPDRPLLLRFADTAPAAWFYMGKALLPINLSPIYPLWNINSHATVTYLPHVLLVGLVALLWMQRNRWGRGPLVTLAAFILMLAPVLGLLNINYYKFSLVADHWQYFSLPIATAAIVWGICRIFSDATIRTAALAAAVATFAILSWKQSQLYDNSRIWRATLEKNPNSYVAANNLGEELAEHEQFDEALKYFQRALEIHPGYHHALMGEASAYLQLKKYGEAIPPLEELLQAQPNNFFVRFNIGSAFLLTGKPQQAIEQFRAALELPQESVSNDRQWRMGNDNGNTMRADLQSRLGDALMLSGKTDEALKAFEASLELNPQPGVHYRIATVLNQKHDRAGARKHWREVLRLVPGNVDALNDFAWSCATDAQATAAEKAEAKQFALQAGEITKFGEPGILDTLAAACAASGDFDDALKYGKQAQQLASAKGDKQLAADLERRNNLYAQKQAYTE
jgi:tetratricopeptide (TPR) repeat protein